MLLCICALFMRHAKRNISVAIYCNLWPVRLYQNIPYILIPGTFQQKFFHMYIYIYILIYIYIICFDLLYKFVHSISQSKKNSEIL